MDKSACRFICRVTVAEAEDDGAPQVAACCCGLLADVVMAANCLRVAPILPRIAFFFLFAFDVLVESVGKDSWLTSPTFRFVRLMFEIAVPEAQPTRGADDDEGPAPACKVGNDSSGEFNACCSRTAAACARNSSVR